MKKENFLKILAEHGYNVMYGAKKHFSTYDIVEKIPNYISLITLIIGIVQLYYPLIPYNKEISVIIIIVSVLSFQINQFNLTKEKYIEVGNELIQIHNQLKNLYFKIKDSEKDYVEEEIQNELDILLDRYYEISISKQITFSSWYAHYKFFSETQYSWMDEQINFTWKDKFPKSLIFLMLLIVTIILLFLIFCWIK